MSEPLLPSANAWRLLWKNPVARWSLATLLFVALAAIIGPSLLPAGSAEVTKNQFLPPSALHYFGTDLNGRDVLFRVFEGARISREIFAQAPR